MKVCVNEILKDGLDIERHIEASSLGIETSQITYPCPVTVRAHLERDADTVRASVSISAKARMICSRCLEQFDFNISQKGDFIYDTGNGHFIDLSDDIKDSIMLGYPMRQLCRPDCKGLCHKCGANLNQDSCGCVTR
ncbi:MAG: DUF177 domain-containing protein [Candidatus Omnitrophica bacterium]|nr:DUF177 domain-containing protein [Candidatus Omnitrophota bacterium]